MNLPDTEKLTLLYMPVVEAVLWDENPKEHDYDSLAQSITKYGFQDPCKFDSTLNGGQGGIVYGNGRTYTVKYMMEHGFDRPKGIGEENGMWYVPVIFGNDLANEATAKAFALDHNLLGVVGVNGITHLDAVRMYDQDRFLEVATGLDMVATDLDDLKLMQMLMDRQIEEEPLEEIPETDPKEKLPSISFKFSSEDDKNEFQAAFQMIWDTEHGYENKGDFLLEIVNLYASQLY